MTELDVEKTAPPAEPPSYPILVRVSHWLNAILIVALAGSGLAIFDAHPTLYLSDASDPHHVLFSVQGVPSFLMLGGWLEGGRRIHFAAAWLFAINGILYTAWMLMSRRKRAVWLHSGDVPRLGRSVRDHLRLPLALADEGGALNPLQKAAYLVVTLGLAPLVVATGLAMSPQFDAAFPWWPALLGGRQSARTWHFLAMVGFVGFTLGHVMMVELSGLATFMRMITGEVREEGPR